MKKLESLKDFELKSGELKNVKGGGETATSAGTVTLNGIKYSYTSDVDYGNGHIQYRQFRQVSIG